MEGVLQILFYVALYGVGSLVSIGIPIGIMVYNAVKDRSTVKKPAVPIVLRMFGDDGNYEELIGIPHEMVVQFLENTYNVKIVTNQPKPRPPDQKLLKWLGHAVDMGHDAVAGKTELALAMKDYMPYYAPKRQRQPTMSQLLATLEDYRR